MPENDKLKFSQLAEITRAQMAGSDYAVGYKANGDNKKWTLENLAGFLLNDSEAGQEFQESIAPEYSSSNIYAVGDYVMYNAQLYKCNTAIMTAEAWTAAHWTQVPITLDVNENVFMRLFNSYPFPYRNGYHRMVSHGLTFTYKGNGVFHVSGTAAESNSYNLIDTEATDILPAGFIPGQDMSFCFDAPSNMSDSVINWWYRTSGMSPGSWTQFTDANNSPASGIRRKTLPSGACGLLARIKYVNGKTYDDDFTFYVLNKAPNYTKLESDLAFSNYTAPPAGTDINTLVDNGIWLLPGNYNYVHVPYSNPDWASFLFVYHVANTVTQIDVIFRGTNSPAGSIYKYVFVRSKLESSTDFSPWDCVGHAEEGVLTTDKSGYGGFGTDDPYDVNAIPPNTILLLNDSHTYINKPDGMGLGFVMSLFTGNWRLQLAWDFAANKMWARRGNAAGSSWTAWNELTGTVNNITNNYTFPEYSQALSVTATPQITTDTNNYLASTNDNTDRTADILAMLNETGICRLGPGLFVVNNLQMPDNSSLIGSGYMTKVRLADNQAGFAVKIGSRCLVSDLRIQGAEATLTFGDTIGDRHGILWQGDYTQSRTAPDRSMVSNIWVLGFTGGGITCYDTGYGTSNALEVTNAYILNCWAGLNISYWSEFHKFTNIRCDNCRIGCINNGGNNLFVNCDFSSNQEIAMLMDNSQGQSPNNTHGSAIGCVFNHTASGGQSNSGIGIEILNCESGFVFSGCQIFFSKIHLEDSDGITVSNCNFGYSNCNIEISGGGTVLFIGNQHQNKAPITIEDNNKVHFVNCYNRSTGALIEP